MAGNVIRATLLADASKFKAGLSEADRAVGKTEKSMEGFGKAAVAGFAVVAAGAVVSFAADAVKAFSDVEQSSGSVEAVFGDSAQSIKDQAEGAAEAFGLSASQFQTSAALIGSMLKNQMGLSAEEAADQVSDLTGKAADMAATFGGTTSDAISAIGSLLRGERDPIEKYGVSMSDASIQAYALEKGLAASSSEMTPQIKAAAALEILYEQTADSAGQFAEESDTLAGSQQILAAQIENVQAKLGGLLAPAVSSATGALSDMVTVADELITRLDELQGTGGGAGLPGVSDAAIGMIPIIGQIYTGFQNFKTAIGGVADTLTRDAQPAMEDARSHGVIPLKDATKDLAVATRDSTDAFYDHQNAVRASTDPVFALAEAERAQADAITAAKEAAKEYGRGSPEHLDALGDVKDAAYDVQDAEKAMGTQTGTTRATMETHLRSLAVYTEGQIQLMLDEFDRVNAYSFQAKTISVTHKVTGGGVQEYASGGVVPGPRGSAQMAVVHGGETILPTHKSSGGRTATPMVNNITIHAGLGADPNAISRALVEALQRYERTSGPIPIRTRSA